MSCDAQDAEEGPYIICDTEVDIGAIHKGRPQLGGRGVSQKWTREDGGGGGGGGGGGEGGSRTK